MLGKMRAVEGEGNVACDIFSEGGGQPCMTKCDKGERGQIWSKSVTYLLSGLFSK